MTGVKCTLDHLVVAAATLPAAVAQVATRLGVPLQPGGRHELMGTHNALLGLGSESYLEALAIEPGAVPSHRQRWFTLDDPATRTALAAGPRLLHWVARCNDLESALAHCPWPTGRPLAMSRGSYRWRIAVPDDGALPMNGVAPTLIEWHGAHPALALTERGCRLLQLRLQHPEASLLQQGLERLGLGGEVVEIGVGEARLQACFATPDGPATLG